ncbi:hypothetical protein P175DRAFT_029256 [Aspergillus ochraceoroseus IBT 24754]|uniref:Rhodopsin domain-containing protein n=2 Tax=Aspergillus subgen. Nidulantes TaxID=2720870 RepID=A0A0F8UNR7_9EURO|nr:uncharacterized protein P175DRAFT_029256 [Aspergillus ochraceoroseus IBT 24754]KKK12496.1 hypothetical protein ARAM_005330 [Aspergillus rambellii]PTU24343.1 hypothetical protein P175DRAFT_029256 [Aspergillus ochraceoroseus IBT 24754]
MAIGVPRGRQALVVSATFTSLATLITVVRVYTRAFLVKQMGADDWTILVSLCLSWIFFGLFVGETAYLMGEHYDKVPPATFNKQMICFWASVPIYQATLISTKASILLQYKRVFSTPRMRLACYYLLGFLAVWGTWTFLSAWLNCLPVAKFWNDSIYGYCLDKKALWFSNSSIHIFTDTLILIYPMPVLKNLQLPLRQKLALMCIFALGVFVLVTSVLRLRSLLVIADSSDETYDNVGAATWSAIECNVALMCASLPATRAFISRLLPRFFSTGRSKGTTNPYNDGPRSRTTNHTGFQASIAATNPQSPRFQMNVMGGRADSPGGKDYLPSTLVGEIKVTTIVSQESVVSPQDEYSSLRRLIND